MRIIDKNYDFYDYLQDYTDTIVFDRTGSILLTKEDICRGFNFLEYHGLSYNFVLVQSGATYWLCLAHVQRENIRKAYSVREVIDYNLEVLKMWKNYDKPRHLMKIDIIDFSYKFHLNSWFGDDYYYDHVLNRVDVLADAVNHNDYKVRYEFIREKKPYLLKASGFNACIIPQDLFCAIEEHLSLNKSEAERTEPLGATNDDKIVMHGFDTKKSFRK
jgi:hypothetical protein